MSDELVRARERYGHVPRSLDENLQHLARGDRGCLWLSVSAVGAVTTIVIALLSMRGVVSFSWAYLGLAVWIGATVAGGVVQSRSEKDRRAALRAAPLVAGRVVLAEPHLRADGRRAGRALVVFSLDDDGRRDDARMREAAVTLRHHEDRPLARVRGDRFWPGPFEVSSLAVEPPLPARTHVAWVVVDPLRRQG